MSSAPESDPDHDARLKRAALAWEIRKFRLDAKARNAADAARLALDQQRLDLDRRKFERESSVWSRLGPTLVTSLTAVLGALLGFAGIMYNNYATQRAAQRNRDAQAYIEGHSNFKDSAEQIEARAKILAAQTPDVAAEIFRRLADQSTSPTSRAIWEQGKQVAAPSSTAAAPAPATVYVQYQEPTDQAAVAGVMSALTKAGYYVPGKQRVTQKTNGDVRYYADPGDTATKSKAQTIAGIVEQALASNGSPHSIGVINAHATFPKVPATTFEVWLPGLPEPGTPQEY